MAKLRVTIIDEVRNRRLKVDLPDDAAVEKLLPALAKKLGLPLAAYRLTHEATGRALGGGQTLASFGVREGDALRLTAEEAISLWQKVPVWAWGALGGVVLLIALAGAFLAGRGAKPVPAPTVVAEAVTLAVTEAPTLSALAPAATPAPRTDTPVPLTDTPLPTAPPAEEPAVEESMEGKIVTVFGAFGGEEADRFREAMKPFEERTGIKVEYEGSDDFETLILVRVKGGNPPDVADFPDPGLLGDFVKAGHTIDLNTFLDEDYLKKQYAQSWLDMATMEGQMAGVWHRANVKSLVWYPIPEFEEAGYKIPETWDEMIALSDQMVADGNTPWCIGIESGWATGWVATDWMEDIMLRTTSPENYDKWTRGELPFSSPEVKRAAEIMGEIWFNPDYVYGGTTSILTTFFGVAPNPMFDDPPNCWMHRQASFISPFFDEDVEVGMDVNYFYLPPIDLAYGKPVLGFGDIYGMFNDRPEVREFVKYLTTGESTKAWVEAGGVVSPHKDSSLDWYPTAADRGYAEILMNADTFRFDGSDLMPGAVGAGSFWSGMVDYVSGEDLDKVLADIDASWP